MDEPRRVRERLERIETLQGGDAPEGALLAEVRGLLEDGEAWLASGVKAAEGAAGALDCRGDAVGRHEGVGPKAYEASI